MNCRIDTEDGNIKTVRAENGQESTLFKQINEIVEDKGEALVEYDSIVKANDLQVQALYNDKNIIKEANKIYKQIKQSLKRCENRCI